MNTDLEKITEAFRRKIARDTGLERGTLRFDFKDLGESVYINGNTTPNEVSNDRSSADCTIVTSYKVIEDLVNGRIDGISAVEKGEVAIQGDLRLAMAFGPIEGDMPNRPFIKGNLRFPF